MVKKFSIMIPTYGRPQLLEYAIASALAQNAPVDLEIVVVDNDHNGKFEAENVVKKFSDVRLRYVRNSENKGMCGNWNECIRLADGDWLTILHDDDQLHSDYLAVLLGEIRRADTLSVIGCAVREISHGHFVDQNKFLNDDAGNVIRMNDFDVLRCCPYYPVGVAFRRSIAIELKGFEQTMYPCMDYDFWYRLLQTPGGGALVTKRLAFYRKFENESARVEVLSGFLNQSYIIRERIISTQSKVAQFFLQKYSQKRIVDDSIDLERVWGTAIDQQHIENLDFSVRRNIFHRFIAGLTKFAVVFFSGRKRFKLSA